MTDERLAEIEARHAAATEGPYWLEPAALNLHDDRYSSLCSHKGMIGVAGVDDDGCAYFVLDPPDAEFTAHSWQDIADLLAEVRRLRGENGDLSALVASMQRGDGA